MTPEQRKEYYRKNKESRLAYQKRYYELYKDAIRERADERKKNDPGWLAKQKEYNRKYYLKNRDRINKKRKSRVSDNQKTSDKNSG
jgi:hypothetical protein